MVVQKNGSKRQSTSRATIRDIAAMAGVSIATVSRVVNGRPDVAEDTRELVLQHVREHGYATNRSARGLAGGRTGLAALTLPFMHAEYFSEIASGAAEAIFERDMRFVLCPTQHEHDREVSLLERLMHGTTDGAILLLPSENNAELMALTRQGYPFVVVDPREPLDHTIPVVASAHWNGARAVTEHLIALGHRRIAAITGPGGWCASVDRLAGYRSALHAAGLPASDDLVEEADFLMDGGHRAAQVLLDRPDTPTAIFAFNDNMAFGVMRAARERGMTLPRDLSIAGYDDAGPTTIVEPTLTTVRQPLQEMGRVAAGLLARLLDGCRVDATRIELSNRLIIRDSTGPAPRTQ